MNKNCKVIWPALLLLPFSMTACDSSSTSPPDFDIPASSTINQNTSQAGRQTDLWIDYRQFREDHHPDFSSVGDAFSDAIVYADFDDDGLTDVFTAPGTSRVDSVPLEFYQNNGDGTFELVTQEWIKGDIPELPHPRKSLVADFNANGQPDIFIVGHGIPDYIGMDEEPDDDFPGGQAWVVMSGTDGEYQVSRVTDRMGFYHGAAAGDLTGNGLPDIFITDSPGRDRYSEPEIFLNQGDGQFERAPERLHSQIRDISFMYTAEIVDLNENGYADIIVAGHEQDGTESRVLWGSSSGYFSLNNSTVLPAVPGWGIVVDIAAADLTGSGHQDLVLTRTSGGEGKEPYVGYYLQVIETKPESDFEDITPSALPDGSDTESDWISWTRLQDISGNGRPDILVDDKRFCLRWDNDGSGKFNKMTDACSLAF